MHRSRHGRRPMHRGMHRPLSPLEGGQILRPGRKPVPPTPYGLPRSARTGHRRMPLPGAAAGGRPPGRHLLRHDGLDPRADRPQRHAARPAPRIRRGARRHVRALEGPHRTARGGRNQRPGRRRPRRLHALLRRQLFVRMGLGQDVTLPAQLPRTAPRSLLVGRALRLALRAAGGRHHPRKALPQPLHGRPQGHVARRVARAPRPGFPAERRPALRTL